MAFLRVCGYVRSVYSNLSNVLFDDVVMKDLQTHAFLSSHYSMYLDNTRNRPAVYEFYRFVNVHLVDT